MNFSHTKTPLIPEAIAEGQILKVCLHKQRDLDDWEMKVKGLRKRLTQEDKDKILQDFTDKILDFCESVIPNGSRRGDEWDCSDIYNSELVEGDRGSCSINLAGNGFNDQNPDANPSSGGYHIMFCAIFGLKGVAGWRAMQKWNEDGTLPDGSKGRVSGKRVELKEGATIEALNDDPLEKDRISWIQTFQDWLIWNETFDVTQSAIPGHTHFINNQNVKDIDPEVYRAEHKAQYENMIAWVISNIFSRRWSAFSSITREPEMREKFAKDLAEYRGLSKEVFYWLIDNGEIINMWERMTFSQDPVMNEEGELVTPPPKEVDFFNPAFPVYRNVTPDMHVPEWVGSEDPIQQGAPHVRDAAPTTVFFRGMHVHWTNSKGKHWKYTPKGCTVEPWIVGNLSKADLVVIAESTWDIISYLDLRKMYAWQKTPWCCVATRGAGTAQRISADQIKAGATVARLLQNDNANAAWVASLPYMPQVTHQELQPPAEDKDLNDWIRREGVDAVYEKLYGCRRP